MFLRYFERTHLVRCPARLAQEGKPTELIRYQRQNKKDSTEIKARSLHFTYFPPPPPPTPSRFGNQIFILLYCNELTCSGMCRRKYHENYHFCQVLYTYLLLFFSEPKMSKFLSGKRKCKIIKYWPTVNKNLNNYQLLLPSFWIFCRISFWKTRYCKKVEALVRTVVTVLTCFIYLPVPTVYSTL